MKNLTPKYIVFVIIFPIIYILSSCHHKYICPECESGNRIIFEWEKIEKNLSDLSAEAKSDDISFKDFIGTFSPSHMRVIFYNLDGDLIYNFVLPESGGYADIDPDEYIVACYNVNNSNVEWINIDNPYKLQCTLKTTNLNEYEMSSDNINTQSKFLMPNLVYGSMVFHLNVTKDSDIILVPLLLVDLYTYEIVGIDNAECIKSITASLSGLRKTIFLSGLSKSDTYGIIPFTYNTISPQNDAIIGAMWNFGYESNINYLTLNINNNNNMDVTKEFNVTKKIDDAPDPEDVNILDTLNVNMLPTIVIKPDLDSWAKDSVNIFLSE